MSKVYKSIEYAYPSSDLANKFGYGKTGIYVLEVDGKVIAGGSKDDMLKMANKGLGNVPWSPAYLASLEYERKHNERRAKGFKSSNFKAVVGSV